MKIKKKSIIPCNLQEKYITLHSIKKIFKCMLLVWCGTWSIAPDFLCSFLYAFSYFGCSKDFFIVLTS